MGQRVKKPINEWGIVRKTKNKYQHFSPLKLLITWSCFNNDIPNWWQCFLPPSNTILLLCVLKGCQSHGKHGRKVKKRVQDTKECRAIKSWFSSAQKPCTGICSLILQAFPDSSCQCLCKHLREAKRLLCITGVPGDSVCMWFQCSTWPRAKVLVHNFWSLDTVRKLFTMWSFPSSFPPPASVFLCLFVVFKRFCKLTS